MTQAAPDTVCRKRRTSNGTLIATCALVLLAAAGSASVAAAQSPDDLYKGKTIHLLIGQAAGGGYDTYARLYARFLPQFLPGHPMIVVQNMPGAGSMLMANYLYGQAARDGTVVGLGGGTIATAALFGTPAARFDFRKFSWIGSMNSEVGVAVSWYQSPIKSVADLFARDFVVGGAGANADSVIFPNALNKVLGTRFKIVAGYQGSAEAVLAMERGEVAGIGNWHYSSIVANRPDWLRDKKINVILQLGLGRHAALPDVPTVLDVAHNDDEREILRLVFAQEALGRPILGPPGIPAQPLRLLQDAFVALIHDPQFLAEAAHDGVEINDPMAGEDARALLDRLHAVNPELIRKASAAVSPTAPSQPN